MHPLELKLPPVLQVAIAVTLIVLLAQLLPAANWAFPGHRWLAVIAVVAGLIIALCGVLAFRRARTTVDPRSPAQASTMVVTGIYRFTRNPMYVGMAIGLLGVACWHGTVLGVLVIAGFVGFITRFQIEPEERILSARFGAPYLAYRDRVRRWL